MNRKLIWVVTIFLGLAMASLIIVQAYWIKNAVIVKEKQFDQLVSRSLFDISRELELSEAKMVIMQQASPLFSDTGFFLATAASRTLNQDKVDTGDSSLLAVGDGKSPDNLDPDKHVSGEGLSGKKDNGNITPGASANRDPREWLQNRREFIDRIISAMFLLSPDIKNRINPEMLIDVMQKVFRENGIDLPFEYAVIKSNNEIAFGSDNYDPVTEAEYYKVQLFAEGTYGSPDFLWVYFPGKKSFLFKSLNYMTFSSLMLSLMIILSFSLTVFIIFRQKRLSEIRNDFVSNMTHELKTPISTISLASQMLGDKSIPVEMKNTEQISKIISEECRRLGSQVEKVLQTAVFDRGRLKLKLSEVNIHEIIEGVMENFAIQVKNRNGRIISRLNAKTHLLQADPVHITNVVANLLDNAIKYCNRNPEIEVTTASKGDFLIISVRDNGIGISKNDQKRIFERFYRVPTGNIHAVKGFGLGLSYVRMIVNEHHGYVEVESELQLGSTFRLILPLKEYANHAKD
jgi:two-component system phosphate regulon sensor histidine kinase PhoR